MNSKMTKTEKLQSQLKQVQAIDFGTLDQTSMVNKPTNKP